MSEFAGDSSKPRSEDEYFYKKDRELLARLRSDAEKQRARLEEEHRKKEYWMRCPKCGSSLKEENYGNTVVLDRCQNSECAGVYFDGGELEILLNAKTSLFKKIFKK